MTIYTIGYEGLDFKSFLALLNDWGIETVVDVRELPLSRKPGFSKKAMANALNLSGLAYVHVPALGCPKPVRNAYKEDGNWARYTKGFLKYLNTQRNAIVELSELAGTSNCALLCYEADYNLCHRSFVANAVSEQSGAEVQHIIKPVALKTKVTIAASQSSFAWAGRLN
jgi:uncharacterized protein (DUF488 family)